MSNLSIISFHNSSGAVHNRATTAADSKILLPAVSGKISDCRPPDVRFVSLQLELDFATLAPNHVGRKILKVMYYLELPQTSIDVKNEAGDVRSLVTFHGATDLRTLLTDKIRTDILEEGPYDGPIDLSAA